MPNVAARRKYLGAFHKQRFKRKLRGRHFYRAVQGASTCHVTSTEREAVLSAFAAIDGRNFKRAVAFVHTVIIDTHPPVRLSEPRTQRSGVSGALAAAPLTPLRCVRGSEEFAAKDFLQSLLTINRRRS